MFLELLLLLLDKGLLQLFSLSFSFPYLEIPLIDDVLVLALDHIVLDFSFKIRLLADIDFALLIFDHREIKFAFE